MTAHSKTFNPLVQVEELECQAPKKIDFYGKILTLEVTKTQMPGSPYRATYWLGADDMFNHWGDTPEDTASKLWRMIKTTFPETRIVPEPKDVKMNGRVYTLPGISDAIKFCNLWNGVPMFPINSI
jgi:hypothetical protein